MIPDTRRSLASRAKNWPNRCAANPVGMKSCAETTMRGFSDRLLVLVSSPYATEHRSVTSGQSASAASRTQRCSVATFSTRTSRPPSRRHRPNDAGSGPLRPGRRSLRRPPENPRSRLRGQPRTLRQNATKAAPKTNRRLDQPAISTKRNPSLNSKTGCLKIVDTLRYAHGLD